MSSEHVPERRTTTDRVAEILLVTDPLHRSEARNLLAELSEIDERIRLAPPHQVAEDDLSRAKDILHTLNSILLGPTVVVDLLQLSRTPNPFPKAQ